MALYFIIGAGRFGRLAWQRLREREPQARFTVVDRDIGKLALIPAKAATRTVVSEAADFLAAALAREPQPHWIIPAVPIHLAFAWLLRQEPANQCWRPQPVPAALGGDLPFRLTGSAGEVYLSLATARCPDDCPEPASRCSLTGAPRVFNLYDYLADQVIPGYLNLIVRSHQLAPGVGGFRPADLRQLHAAVLGAGGNVIICTACRCHGVCHGLEKLTGREAGVGF